LPENIHPKFKHSFGISSLDEKLNDLHCVCHGLRFDDLSALARHLSQTRNGHKKGRGQDHEITEESCNADQCRRFLDCDCRGLYDHED
jgi:hypothetical protein